MKTTKKLVALLLTGALLYAAAPVAFAAGSGTNINIAGGSTNISAVTVGNFSPVTLNGADQTAIAAVGDYTVTDARGNGKGWVVQVSATPLTNGTSTMHDGALTISGTTGTTSGHSDSFDPSYISASQQIKAIPSNYIVVPQSKGKGTYTFAGGQIALNIWPTEALAGTYSTTVTFDLVPNI